MKYHMVISRLTITTNKLKSDLRATILAKTNLHTKTYLISEEVFIEINILLFKAYLIQITYFIYNFMQHSITIFCGQHFCRIKIHSIM